MAFSFDEIFTYGGQLIVAAKKVVPNALGTTFLAETISCPPYVNISSNENAILDTPCVYLAWLR